MSLWYFGPTNAGYASPAGDGGYFNATSPWNPSLSLGANHVGVLLQNHSFSSCANVGVQVYYAAPSTNVLFTSLNFIGSDSVFVRWGDDPSGDGWVPIRFDWTPPYPDVALVALGNCIGGDCTGIYDFSGDSVSNTDPRSAVLNVHVASESFWVRKFGGGLTHWGQDGERRSISFGFGTSNGSRHAMAATLSARALDPARDQRRLLELMQHEHIRAKVGRCAKVALPKEVRLAFGSESIIHPSADHSLLKHHDCDTRLRSCRDLSNTGTLRPEVAQMIVAEESWDSREGGETAHRKIALLPRQIQQTVVEIVPAGREGHIHAVEIRQEVATPDGACLVGGMTIVFVPLTFPW